jgi:hypothetical protein
VIEVTPAMSAATHGSSLSLSPRGRGREAMTYARVRHAGDKWALCGAGVSHSAELVRGYLPFFRPEASLSGPSGRPRSSRGQAHESKGVRGLELSKS